MLETMNGCGRVKAVHLKEESQQQDAVTSGQASQAAGLQPNADHVAFAWCISPSASLHIFQKLSGDFFPAMLLLGVVALLYYSAALISPIINSCRYRHIA